jgi:hypothetical protein
MIFVSPPIAISAHWFPYDMNMMTVANFGCGQFWVFMMLTMDVHVGCENRSEMEIVVSYI